MFFPKNISTSGLNLIKQRCDPTVWNYVLDQQDKGWRIYCVLQGRGRCYYRERVITIPFWTIEANSKKPGYITWYVAHELAHSMDRNNYNHGPAFMAELKEFVHQLAGITKQTIRNVMLYPQEYHNVRPLIQEKFQMISKGDKHAKA